MVNSVTHYWSDPVPKSKPKKAKPLNKTERSSEPILKPPELFKKDEPKPEIKPIEPDIKTIDLTENRKKCLDYKDVKVNQFGEVEFNIRLWDKGSVLRLHTIICEKEEAIKFAKKILHLTSKYSEIYKIIDE